MKKKTVSMIRETDECIVIGILIYPKDINILSDTDSSIKIGTSSDLVANSEN